MSLCALSLSLEVTTLVVAFVVGFRIPLLLIATIKFSFDDLSTALEQFKTTFKVTTVFSSH
jgi:hypothetical protein